ncbi:MAG TPA: ATP-binding protein [Urbifossiella sp.]|nr:ATP-binding protein [Urbifossiella sp.]
MTPLNGSRLRDQLAADTLTAGGAIVADPADEGSVGRTLFDLPGSTDLTVTVVVPKERVKDVPSQALVRIRSRADGRTYLGVVAAGPFAEPDGLKGDSPILTAVATHGGDYLPPYHGRVHVTLLGEELDADTLVPPRLRPLPNSTVFVLSDAESGRVLKCEGDIRLGLAAGHEGVEVRIPSEKKAVLPRHTAILGTTGGGKSTTVAGFVKQAADAGVAVVLLDVEGEYVHLHEPTDHPGMTKALAARGIAPAGLKPGSMSVYHLVGRGTANPDHPDCREFTLQFARLSPHAMGEILNLSDAQVERYWKAYEITKEVMRELELFPVKEDAEQQRMALELDEFERGYPRMTLSLLMDVVGACMARAEPKGEKKASRKAAGDEDDGPSLALDPFTPVLKDSKGLGVLTKRVHAANPPGNVMSWRALLGKLARLNRLKVFHTEPDRGSRPDPTRPLPMKYANLLQPGRVSVVDLSDTGHSELNNLVIADILRGLQEAQEEAYERYEQAVKRGESPPQPRVLVVIEEAHEFLSAERIDKMDTLFQQVARIAKRGRKRWLGLCFVTQLPGHLPKQVLGLCNSFVLHKLTDPSVVSVLKRTVPGVEDALWDRLPALAAGQAIASFPHLTRPLLVSVDPAPGKLRMVD